MRVLLLAMAISLGGGASAQTIEVRGGEHDDFSRLVLSLPDGVAWSFDPAPGGYDLRLPPGISYDLRNAFKRIPRDRISALIADGKGRLGLAVSCDCHAQAYAIERVGLVIDVIDGPPPLGGLAPGQPAGPSRSPALLPLMTTASDAGPVLGPLARLAVGSAVGPRASREVIAERAEAQRVAEVQRAMMEGVAAAATQGLLDLAPGTRAPDPRPADRVDVQDVESQLDAAPVQEMAPPIPAAPEAPILAPVQASPSTPQPMSRRQSREWARQAAPAFPTSRST